MLSNSDATLREEECEETFTEARKNTRVVFKDIGQLDDASKGAVRMTGPNTTPRKRAADDDSDDMDLDDIWGSAPLAKCSKARVSRTTRSTDNSSHGDGEDAQGSDESADEKPQKATAAETRLHINISRRTWH